MRRMLLAGLVILAPAVAFAAPANMPTDDGQATHQRLSPAPPSNGNGALGSGMVGGNEPGHVESPGVTKIDNDSRAPINDVQPGRGTNDTHQSSKPKPVR